MLQIRVIGKGRRGRSVDYGIKTRKALRNYEKARSLHPLANLDWLWLGNRGKQLTQSGIAQLLRRRCRAASELHPHMFSNSFAHSWLASGREEGDLMKLAGWSSRDMLQRHGPVPPLSVPTTPTAVVARQWTACRQALSGVSAGRSPAVVHAATIILDRTVATWAILRSALSS